MGEPLVVECNFRMSEQYEGVFGKRGEKTKAGSYHRSYFAFEGYGRSKWVVVAVVEGDFEEHGDYSDEEIVEACVRHLNIPVGKRKKRKPYGNLELYRFSPRDDGSYTVLLKVDEKKNKHFWGKGSHFATSGRKRRKKGA